MGKFLKKFLDTSLIAAAIVLLAKLLGVWIGLMMTKVEYSLNTSTLLTYISVSTVDQVKRVTLFADAIFLAIVIAVVTFMLVKTLLFNDLTRSPRVMVKVIHYNLTSWLEDGKSMYPKLFAWGVFVWLTTILITKDYLTTGITIALPLASGAFSIFYTYCVFAFLDTHISDMISYLYGEKRKAV